MRRYAAIAAALAGAALVLSGCTSEGASDTAAEETAVAEAPAEEAPAEEAPAASDDCTYYWLAANITHPFYVEGKAGWNKAAEELGVKAELVGPLDPDVQQQVAFLEQIIAQPDQTCGLYMYAIDYNTVGPIMKKVREAGIPVINGNGDSEDKTIRDAFIGTDNVALGRAGSVLACEALGGKGTVGIVSFITAQNHQERVRGFEEGITANCPDVKVLPVSPNDGTAEGAFTAANGLITSNPDVNLIWATDAGSPGVARAVEERDLVGKILVVGTDRTAEQIEAIKKGVVSATITQDTTTENYVGLYMLDWLRKGLQVPDTVITKSVVIDANNVDTL